ncbi:MAG: HEPN domain-containing protein [Actinobacteria bacterium]|nr:HEPN domain-containing protein [Actinomycetota bacterium]
MKNKITKEWFKRGKHDFETVKLIFKQEGYYDEIILLLQQSIERYLKKKNAPQ